MEGRWVQLSLRKQSPARMAHCGEDHTHGSAASPPMRGVLLIRSRHRKPTKSPNGDPLTIQNDKAYFTRLQD